MTFLRWLHIPTALSAILVLSCFTAFGQHTLPTRLGRSVPIAAGRQYEINSAILGEKRILNIYLPEGYSKNDTARYPVIYLLDGSLNEDYLHVIGLVAFNSYPWVARTPRSIVVGISNIDRKRDFTFPTSVKSDQEKYPTTGGADRFIAFIEKELQPYVQRSFKTTDSKTIIGESLGGLLAVRALFTKPTLFNRYIIISPSLWWDNGSILKSSISSDMLNTGTKDIFLAVGKEGLAPSEEPHVMEVDVNVLKDKIDNWHNNNVHVFLDYLPDEEHATLAHQALVNAFKWLHTISTNK